MAECGLDDGSESRPVQLSQCVEGGRISSCEPDSTIILNAALACSGPAFRTDGIGLGSTRIRPVRPRTNDRYKWGKYASREPWAASPGHKSASGTEVSRWQGVRLPQATHLAQAKVPGQRLPVGRQASRTWQNPPSEVM